MVKRRRKAVRKVAGIVGGLRPNQCKMGKGRVRVCNRGGKLVTVAHQTSGKPGEGAVVRVRNRKGKIQCVRILDADGGWKSTQWVKASVCSMSGKVYTWAEIKRMQKRRQRAK